MTRSVAFDAFSSLTQAALDGLKRAHRSAFGITSAAVWDP
jgi:hypothetical protein